MGLGAASADHQGRETADERGGAKEVELGESRGPRLSLGRTCAAMASVTRPIGTLIQKMACQPAHVVRAPPSEDAAGDAETTDRAPQSEASCSLYALVGGHDQGESGGCHQGGARALGGATGMSSPALVAKPLNDEAAVKGERRSGRRGDGTSGR